MDFGLLIGIVLGLIILVGLVFAAFVAITLLEAAFSGFNELEYDDEDDDILDETNHIRPLLGVVHPKEK
jgi:uncharacterized membrane protein required for colicin V production